MEPESNKRAGSADSMRKIDQEEVSPSLLGQLFEVVKSWFCSLFGLQPDPDDSRYNVCVIAGKISFQEHVVDWFRNICYLDQERHVPFIADARKLNEIFQYNPKLLKCLFIGVYDEKTEQIIEHRILEAEDFDAETRNVLGDEPLVVLQ